ncbi:tRNA processing endoribonuclease [Colletotrichum truncatum]|uniref:tRNA processing endoribonuclease n=1 Tax=Colletotrichum truncatum TaxID=5467 RepID=A0ACC3ZDF8_COLTU
MDHPTRPDSPPRRLRACVPCTTAKARCNFRDENAGVHLCDRCERLRIVCTAKTTRSVRRPRQLKPMAGRLAYLEKQIASLMTTDRTGSADASASSSSHPNTSSPQYGREGGYHDPGRRQTVGNNGRYSTAAEAVEASLTPPFGLTWTQATFILNEFRTFFTPNFPFVIIDGETTPQNLLRDKPLLFRAVMLVAAPLPYSRTTEMKSEVMAYLGHRMLLEEEETLDILQGILIIVMWADIKYFHDKQITRLVYLALGYAHSLGITKLPLSVLQLHGSVEQPDDCFASKIAASMKEHHTLEEQRAFLGLFCVVTVNSSQFARRNPLLQQAGGGFYVDVCCESLLRSGWEQDALAAKMVRFYQISGRIAETFGSFANRATGESYATLFEAQAVAIRREVDRIGAEIDYRDPSLAYLWMQYNSVVVQLYEPATTAAMFAPMHRAACLLECLAAAKVYFDALTSLPPEMFLYRTTAHINHAQIAVTSATRLLVLEVEGWDLKSARASLDFLDTTERMSSLFRATAAAGKERMRRFAEETGAEVQVWMEDDEGEDEGEGRGGMCRELIDKMRWIGGWYRSRLQAEGGKVPAEPMNKELMEEITRIWHWSPNSDGLPFFGGLLNTLDVSYEGI